MTRTIQQLRSLHLAASDGEVGKVQDIYFDDAHWQVRYLVVRTGSWLTERDVLIAPHALGEIDPQSGAIAVHLTREQVRNAPPIETDKPISRQYEERLHESYQWQPYWGVPGGMMLPPPGIAPPQAFAPPPKVTDELRLDASDSPQRNHRLRSSAELFSGYTVHAQDGEIGRVEDLVVDASDWTVRYLVIHTGVWFLGKDALLAPSWIERISYESAEIFVNLPRAVIKDAPEYDSKAPLSRAFEQRLCGHYGRKGYWDAVQAAHRP